MNVLLILFLLFVPFYLHLWLIAAKQQNLEPSSSKSPISVIIPFRNEINNLESLKYCIDRLELISGDEIILVDDQSNDQGVNLLIDLRSECRLVSIPPGNSGSKKEALRLGISLAQNDWILTTDADCKMSSRWIRTWRTEINSKRDFIVGKIALTSSSNSILELFISCEHLALQALTKASINRKVPMMCSGANLMFRKSIWEATGAYSSHLNIASGDDVLFMKDVSKHGGRIAFANGNGTLVTTYSAATISSWLQQRLRWMSKSSHIDTINSRFHSILLLIWLFVFPAGLSYFGWIYLLLIISECLVLRMTSPIQPKISNYLFWPFFRVLYPIMILFLFAASFFVKLKWKDRAIASEA